MAKQWKYFLFILWICYLIISGILLFTRGFLLTRDSFKNTSNCTDFNKIICSQNISLSNLTNEQEYCEENKLRFQNIDDASNLCFPKKSKVILLIIDAFRYDFATYDENLENAAPFQNKLTIINDLLKYPEHGKLYKFIADPPTTTMQRLKALTTGGLPTFIDAGSNFASPEINEDNIIDQLVTQNQSIIFLGDDTWSNLYPKRFTRSWPFPSFNVFDLDTVDQGIVKHLYREISKNDWTLLIAHFLGVDHCGHRYGPYHNEMERKLKEMNNVIKNVVDNMDNDTILYVIGDHGMTGTGDHGGESDLEITSTLFIYSPTPLRSFETDEKINSVRQIDLIPTLATILGVPIPYSNLGSIILDAFPTSNNTELFFTDWQRALIALWTNVKQIKNYINKYSETSNQLKAENVEKLKIEFLSLQAKIKNVKNESDFKIFLKQAKEYLIFVRKTCEEAWIHFDSFSMSRGLLTIFLTIFFVYMVTVGIPAKKLSEILLSSFVFCSYCMMIISAIAIFVCYYFNLVENFELTLFFATSMISFVMLAIIVVQNWEIITTHWYEKTKVKKWLDISIRLILILFLCTIFSNSYILEEAKVLSYLIIALIIFIIYDTVLPTKTKVKWNSTKTKLVILGIFSGILIRFSMFFWKCREEQKNCFNIFENYSEKSQNVISLVFLAVFVTFTKMWLKSCGNLVGFSLSVLFAKYFPTVIVVCSTGFWILFKLPKEHKNKLFIGSQIDILAWVVYGLIFFGIIVIIIQPLFVYILPKKKETVSIVGRENIIPQIFNHVKGLCEKNDDQSDDSKQMPVVYGLGTVYSATFVIVSVLLCLLIALLLGNEFAPSVVIMYFTGSLVLAIISISNYKKATNIAQLFDVPNSSILCWVLLSHYFFYATGHQPSFPSIHWKAAFVGTGGNFNHNLIPATLIGINTFGSFIFMGLTLPLLIIGPFTLYIMFPSLFSNKINNNKDLRRGELIFYEHDDLLMRGMMSLVCKYILFHGIRMFACMLAVTIHCRHLMVWSIFAPKLIFEGIGIMVSLASVLISYLLLIHVNNKVETLISTLEKQN